jgi:hypothetical protein
MTRLAVFEFVKNDTDAYGEGSLDGLKMIYISLKGS